ncbi:hypothetical protein KUV75_01815 [Qipengyuania gaetbuli]|uniref:hypothetical protein n=1 Tax=Qipengyuania gaetbuli TaxID=266952 RepID=UPI001C9961D2|nr:hypothetical protein [Qipengyuania gaetbuli]MBY6013640.1 hypothetical protein [Qipengyuania gaetbuli]
MPDPQGEDIEDFDEPEEGDIMAGDRRIARADTALPDWYASDTHYRPIPIVWFAGALLLQVITQPVVVFLGLGLLGLSPLVVLALALLATGLIWHHTWERGMSIASGVWKAATFAMLAFFLGITALGLAS